MERKTGVNVDKMEAGNDVVPQSVGICIPACNAGSAWPETLKKIRSAAAGRRLLIIDSSSDDDTGSLAYESGCELSTIRRRDFNHGATRNLGLKALDECDIVVFMTQDSLPVDEKAIEELVKAFDDPSTGAAYGRQLPHADATPIAAHARFFNYPESSHRVHPESIRRMGIKAAFLSNSFAAYRRQALLEAGGFLDNAILGEDMVAGARLLAAGWTLAYCPQAQVFHSHNHTVLQEFRRYFDIGVLHGRESWMLTMTGRAEGEGQRFVASELRYLRYNAPGLIPAALLRNIMKYLGYRLGKAEQKLPQWLKKRLSMQPDYWHTP